MSRYEKAFRCTIKDKDDENLSEEDKARIEKMKNIEKKERSALLGKERQRDRELDLVMTRAEIKVLKPVVEAFIISGDSNPHQQPWDRLAWLKGREARLAFLCDEYEANLDSE